ncbi:hypothetical protein FOXB_00615 [Fusarium oxysporum f. sp. conglutinans Fo5176]|uniref:Uncharacterized protein n=1 Tax=Fusarium oxysporum (strain Fo5176) TaxID=660025 RepID=F9F2J1_FUSOF|nr:hypothetical protein FOXB_00615 [Fusarium oxysporum f. sp. conglutinans Fo5176]KAI8414360.1 hypothetical protein FOFC_03970 [Fusarium oxysporum]
MRFSTAIITSLAALSQGYVLTAYKNVDDCKAEGDTNYRIYKGDYDGCQSSVASRAQPVRSTPMAAPSGPMLVQVTSGRCTLLLSMERHRSVARSFVTRVLTTLTTIVDL